MSRRGSVLEGIEFKGMDATPQYRAAELGQRNRELDMQERQMKKKPKEDYGFINQVDIADIGENTVDVLTREQLGKVKGAATEMAIAGRPKEEVQFYLQNEVPKIDIGHQVAKNYKAQIDAGITGLKDKYGDGADLSAARGIAYKKMLKSVLKFDEKGNAIGYQDASLIPKNENFVTYLENEENLPNWYKPNNAITKGVQTMPLTKYESKLDIRDARGKVSKVDFLGDLNTYHKITQNPTTGEPVIGIKSETVTLGQNPDGSLKTIDVLPKEQFDILTDTPAKKAEFYLLFKDNLRNNTDTQHGWDDNSITELDPRARDVMERAFAKSWLEKTGIHGGILNKKAVEQQPIPRYTTNNNINMGGQQTPTVDAYGKIVDQYNKFPESRQKSSGLMPFNEIPDKKVQNIVLSILNNGEQDRSKWAYKENNVVLKLNDNGELQAYTYPSNKLLTSLSAYDINTEANKDLNKTWGSKQEERASKNIKLDSKGQKKEATKTYNIVDPRTNKVVMQGVDEEKAKAAQSKGYKLQ